MDFYDVVSNEYLQLAKENIKTEIVKVEILAEDETVIGEIGNEVIQGSDNPLMKRYMMIYFIKRIMVNIS